VTEPAAPPPPAAGPDLLSAVTFDAGGLVPVIAQDATTGVVRMFAWANAEALTRTIASGAAVFWSRSRRGLWRKGETSGHRLWVREVRVDCDGDVVLYLVDADGPSCHTEHTSCFFRGVVIPESPDRLGTSAASGAQAGLSSDAAAGATPGVPVPLLTEDDAPPDPPAVVISRVAEVIARRQRERPEKSYVVSLLDAGWDKILGKIREESAELVEALPQGDPEHTAHEAADLVFHVLVGLRAAGIPVEAVFAQLRRRFGVSGIDEKARRQPPPPPPATGQPGG
jgi:phosphoribosyl-ATP pyrophosphohydrolase/phosphoribosyl-AMP cyclohydrolase